MRSLLARCQESDSKLFLKRSAIVTLIRVMGLACVLLVQILLARLIGDSTEFGKYAWGQSLLFMVGMLATIGVPVAASRFIASLNAHRDAHSVTGLIRHAQRLLLRTCCVVIIGALALWLYADLTESDNLYLELAVTSLLLAPTVTFATLYRDISMAHQWQVLAGLPLQVLRPVVLALLASLVWWASGYDLTGYVVLWLAGLSMLLVLLPQAVVYHRRQMQCHLHADPIEPNAEFLPRKLFRTALHSALHAPRPQVPTLPLKGWRN